MTMFPSAAVSDNFFLSSPTPPRRFPDQVHKIGADAPDNRFPALASNWSADEFIYTPYNDALSKMAAAAGEGVQRAMARNT